MSGKQIHQQEEQIRRYLQDQMTEAERHAFEREMQRDPFLEEAVEGLSAVTSDLVFTDLAELRKRMVKPERNRRYIWYAAASVLLLIVSSVVLLTIQENVIPVVSESKIQEEVKIADATNAEKSTITPQKQPIPEKTTQKKEIIFIENELITDDLLIKSKLVDDNNSINSNSLISEYEESRKARSQTTRKVEFSKMAANNSESVVSTPIIMDSSGTVPGKLEKNADAMMKDSEKMEEVVVVGYGTQRKSSVTGSVSKVNINQNVNGKASPAGGWKAFEEYLKAELSAPETGKPGEKTIVRLSFVITETGEKEQYQILKGKDETYTKEAIRIVRDGPAWIPEVREKTPRRSTVKLKLVFKP